MNARLSLPIASAEATGDIAFQIFRVVLAIIGFSMCICSIFYGLPSPFFEIAKIIVAITWMVSGIAIVFLALILDS